MKSNYTGYIYLWFDTISLQTTANELNVSYNTLYSSYTKGRPLLRGPAKGIQVLLNEPL